MDVTDGKIAGRLYLITRMLILSMPGALSLGINVITFWTSSQLTGLNEIVVKGDSTLAQKIIV